MEPVSISGRLTAFSVPVIEWLAPIGCFSRFRNVYATLTRAACATLASRLLCQPIVRSLICVETVRSSRSGRPPSETDRPMPPARVCESSASRLPPSTLYQESP